MVFVHNFTGIYAFGTSVIENKGNSLVVKHSMQKKRFQRREFYRKQIKLPVMLKKTDSSDEPAHAFIVDISAGGVCIHHPRLHITKGDDLKIYFQKMAEDLFYLNAEVLRVAKKGSEVSVRFEHLSGQSMDRIIGMMNIQK